MRASIKTDAKLPNSLVCYKKICENTLIKVGMTGKGRLITVETEKKCKCDCPACSWAENSCKAIPYVWHKTNSNEAHDTLENAGNKLFKSCEHNN